MKIKEYFKVVLILPGNVLVTIPLLIFLFTKNSFSYDLINFISPLFYIAIFFLVIGSTFNFTILTIKDTNLLDPYI